MRLSLRKAVTLAAFVAALLLVNVLIGFKLSFSGIENSEKVLGHLRHDNGEPLSSGSPLHDSLGQDVQSRQQRSAKSVPRPFLIDNLEPGAEVKSRISNGAQKGKLSTELAKSQRLSHARPTELGDIFISVKTSGKFHATRLQLVLQTWYLLAREQTYFFTDKDDPAISQSTGGHLVNTNCTPSHTRQSLCCKTSVEFDAYLASKKRWMCHFDDDTYVNIPELVDLLKRYKHTEDWYLGKPSLRHPMEVNDVYNPGAKVTFWFATGSGFCVSRGLALKMMPHAGGGRLKAIGDKLRLPDDCVIGYIIEHLLKTQLTVIEGFRSHLEALWLIKSTQLKKQITLSYSKYGDKENVVNVAGFSHEEDPTRMKSVHCHLFSTFRECKKIQHA
ncbi:fringe glycosyltransferase-like [Littorina saxatilis]|uniref:Fringe-like glycosyltransferase domain-containing protein n=1 Tax=Littorina saxatilis TaxID=31220 RepID=A0AAN9GLH7_9CAEN